MALFKFKTSLDHFLLALTKEKSNVQYQAVCSSGRKAPKSLHSCRSLLQKTLSSVSFDKKWRLYFKKKKFKKLKIKG